MCESALIASDRGLLFRQIWILEIFTFWTSRIKCILTILTRKKTRKKSVLCDVPSNSSAEFRCETSSVCIWCYGYLRAARNHFGTYYECGKWKRDITAVLWTRLRGQRLTAIGLAVVVATLPVVTWSVIQFFRWGGWGLKSTCSSVSNINQCVNGTVFMCYDVAWFSSKVGCECSLGFPNIHLCGRKWRRHVAVKIWHNLRLRNHKACNSTHVCDTTIYIFTLKHAGSIGYFYGPSSYSGFCESSSV